MSRNTLSRFIGQVRMKSYMPSRKIYLMWTTEQQFFSSPEILSLLTLYCLLLLNDFQLMNAIFLWLVVCLTVADCPLLLPQGTTLFLGEWWEWPPATLQSNFATTKFHNSGQAIFFMTLPGYQITFCDSWFRLKIQNKKFKTNKLSTSVSNK